MKLFGIMSKKKDDICGLTGQQKFPSAWAFVSSAKHKTESIQRQVKLINNLLIV